MRVLVGLMIILLGIIVIVTPSYIKYENEKAQTIMLERVKADIKSDLSADDSNDEVNKSNDLLPEYDAGITDNSDENLDQSGSNVQENYDGPIGIIKIDKIDLELPLMGKCTDDNLDIAPSRMEESGKLGEIGNFSIAGHRSYTYGRQFNRLDEVALDDTIQIESGGTRYTFTVNDIFTVKPEEVWVLDSNGEDKMITLITCTPIRVATHRLIVRGILTSTENIKKE